MMTGPYTDHESGTTVYALVGLPIAIAAIIFMSILGDSGFWTYTQSVIITVCVFYTANIIYRRISPKYKRQAAAWKKKDLEFYLENKDFFLETNTDISYKRKHNLGDI